MVHDLRREVPDAIKAYNEVLRLNPRAVAAQVALSRLNLAAATETSRCAMPRRRNRSSRQAERALALARSLSSRGDLGRAETEIAELLAASRTQRLFTRSMAAPSPTSTTTGRREHPSSAPRVDAGNFEAIAGLVGLDLQAKQFGTAINRIDASCKNNPIVRAVGVGCGGYIQAGQSDKAEQALRRAVTVDPRFSTGYGMLAQFYMRQHRLDEARAEFEGMSKRDPRAVGPRTMVGVILEAQGKRDEARRWYEATVAEMSNAPVAANNLAFIYAEEGTNLDVALQLASSAKQQIPDSADVGDTLGWVYYKKDLATMAVGPLEDSVKKKPDSAEILYHLGLTYAKIGEKAKAREALERA
jgi:tetratricopeptide (TPR) repeat protein